MNSQQLSNPEKLTHHVGVTGKSLRELLFKKAPQQSHETAITCLDVRGEETESLSWQALRESATAHAAAMQKHADKGAVVLLAFDNNANFVSVFFGCVLAGLIAVPVPLPRNQKDMTGVKRIAAIAADARAQLIVSEKQVVAQLAQVSDLQGQLLSIEQVQADARASEYRPVTMTLDDTAYLQYTSGSTAQPKGVHLTHSNVMTSLAVMTDIFEHAEEVIICGWLPLHHDMGLVGHLLYSLYHGGHLVLMPPATFLSDPGRWFSAIEKYRANLCAVPNFALAHCVKKIRTSAADISSLNNIFVGSEYVSVPTLEAFCSKFKDNGFSPSALIPVYGLAEATLLAGGGRERFPAMKQHITAFSGSERSAKRQLLGYQISPHFPVYVTDDNRILISGKAVTDKYWPNKTEFSHSIDGKSYFETGDLGFIRDGRLYLTGRVKDTLIIRGNNHYSEDLEYSVSQVVGDLHGVNACIAVPSEEREKLIVIQEVARHTPTEQLQRLEQKILAILPQEHGVNADEVLFIVNQTLPRTLNHKVSKAACVSHYEAGILKVLKYQKAAVQKPQSRPDTDHGQSLDEPVAIVSMACRLPGGCDSPEAFWEMLAAGVDAVKEVPLKRWDNDKFFDATMATPGKTNTRWAGFIDDIDLFDPAFFGISPTEAMEMDPQQRILLETSWRLFEGAGITLSQLKGSDTGVFVGVSTNDYLYMKIKLTPGMGGFNAYSGLGNANSITANRLSYLFDLKGPSMAVDTACSSSLTALHLAAQAVKSGECSQAIAGGVNALISPGPTISLSQFGMMAPDGRCKTFDSRADGYVRAEGCALVMLKRKSEALRDGDDILGYIRGSSLAQDGHSNGITHPNAEAQEQLIKRTLAKTDIDPGTITYIEAHGTGTSAGDPIEVNNLRKLYGDGNQTCHIGSVKASIGHLEAGAGIASVLKVLTMLRHGQIPPQLHVKALNPDINLSGSRLKIPQELTPWQCQGTRRAAISSFGFGGALAHVIMEQAPQAETSDKKLSSGRITGLQQEIFVLSAADHLALVNQANIWIDWLQNSRANWHEMSLASVCYSQAVHRSSFKQRRGFTATSFEGLLKELQQFVNFQAVAATQSLPAKNYCAPAFVFTGQGQNYFHMGADLYKRFEVFRNAFQHCADIYHTLSEGQSLTTLVFDSLEHAEFDASTYQCHLFATQYSLAQQWQMLGVSPQVLIGHSVGEFAAAVVAGCMSVEDAMELLYRRGKLVETVATGEMVSLAVDVQIVESVFPNIAIAARNSHKSTVISGPPDHITWALAVAKEKGIDAKKLQTQRAFHSPMMDPILTSFVSHAAQVQYKAPSIPWISTVTGELKSDAPDAQYWGEHLRQTVLFETAAQKLSDIDTFIEIGPGGTLLALLNDCLTSDSTLSFLRSCNRPKANRGEMDVFMDSLAKYYQQGASLQWPVLYQGQPVERLAIPAQGFNRKRHWLKDASWDKLDVFASATDAPAQEKSTDDAPMYQVNWTPVELNREQVTESLSWILVGESDAFSETLQQSLSGNVFQIPAQGSRIDYYAALSKILNLKSKVGEHNWRVLFLNGLPRYQKTDVDSLNCFQAEQGPADLTHLVQAILDTGEVMPLWVMMCRAHLLPGDDASQMQLSQSSMWGFCRTLFLEQPQLRGGMIDVDEPGESLLDYLHHPQSERAVALRNEHCYVPQLEPLSVASSEQRTLRNDGVYIITGGLGGLGLASCEWLLKQGIKNVILLGRSEFPPREKWPEIPKTHAKFAQISILLRLEKESKNARVSVCSLDIRSSDSLAKLINGLRQPLRGIIHAAGVNWFCKVAELDSQQMLETLKTNISAAWLLHELTAKQDLDCFIMYSSVSALWGSVELSHYTAANYFLDCLAHFRHAQGLPALSVNWGPWDQVGMSAKEEEKAVLGKLGLKLMAPMVALDAMQQLLNNGNPQAIVGGVDWDKFSAFINFSLSPSLFARVTQERDDPQTATEGSQPVSAVVQLPKAEALQQLDSIVRAQLASVMLIDSIDTLDENHRFNFLGMDSLMAISFAAQLEQVLGIKVPNTLAYNYPTIKAVKEYVYQEMACTESTVIADSSSNRWLLPIDDDAADMNIYCFPYAGSGASVFNSWKGKLPGSKLIAIQYPGRETHDDSPILDMSQLTQAIVQQIDTSKPVALLGHSLGAVIAWEVALQLQAQGNLPNALFLSGCDAPLEQRSDNLHLLDEDGFINSVLKKFDLENIEPEHKNAILANKDLLRADITLLETYQPTLTGIDCPLHVFGGKSDPVTSKAGLQSWITLSNGTFSLTMHNHGHYPIKSEPDIIIKKILAEI